MDLEALQRACRAGERFRHLFFWGHRQRPDGSIGPSCLSNWFPAPFEVEGVQYPTAEHWMMAEKARLFGDRQAREAILTAPHPGAAKRLGRRVRGFEEALWVQRRYDIVVRGVTAKFEQNAALRSFLRNTGRCVLVEASPTDRIWGIGLAKNDPRAANPLEWNGLNLLGFALMDAREQLGQGEHRGLA